MCSRTFSPNFFVSRTVYLRTMQCISIHLMVLTTTPDVCNIICSLTVFKNTILHTFLYVSTNQYLAVHNAFQSAVLQKETAVLRSQCTKLQVLIMSEHALIVKPSLYFLLSQQTHTHTLSITHTRTQSHTLTRFATNVF